ncbi:Uncharacterized protein Adt_09560 [Abeliophyllum distichum]|uniref:BHLH domain-containing protein n=1 Tax=Abeliophyllum distichum TaxID=126358 RepID=A0ABD1UHI6_9LAMI
MEKGQSKSSFSSTRAPRIERKIIEKNRRNQMKTLYSNLLYLLPDHASKVPLPDQIDEAVTYIESLKMKLEKMKEKKESLMPRKRSHSCITSEIQANPKSPPPLMVLKLSMQIFLSMEIPTIEILHDKVGKSRMGFGATTMSRRLKDLICGSTCSEVESNLGLWDYEIQSDIWGLGISGYSQWF